MENVQETKNVSAIVMTKSNKSQFGCYIFEDGRQEKPYYVVIAERSGNNIVMKSDWLTQEEAIDLQIQISYGDLS